MPSLPANPVTPPRDRSCWLRERAYLTSVTRPDSRWLSKLSQRNSRYQPKLRPHFEMPTRPDLLKVPKTGRSQIGNLAAVLRKPLSKNHSHNRAAAIPNTTARLGRLPKVRLTDRRQRRFSPYSQAIRDGQNCCRSVINVESPTDVGLKHVGRASHIEALAPEDREHNEHIRPCGAIFQPSHAERSADI